MWIDQHTTTETADFIPLLRPKPGKSVIAFLVGPPLRLFLHYWCKKSWPCVPPNCPLCARRASRRLYSYYPTVSPRGNPAVLELTPVSEAALLRQLQEHSDEPTGVVKVTRPSGRRNMPCEVQWRPLADTDPVPRPPSDPMFLVKTLCRMWKLECPDGDPTSADWIAELTLELSGKIAEQESNS
jgi:hypothetical protein